MKENEFRIESENVILKGSMVEKENISRNISLTKIEENEVKVSIDPPYENRIMVARLGCQCRSQIEKHLSIKEVDNKSFIIVLGCTCETPKHEISLELLEGGPIPPPHIVDFITKKKNPIIEFHSVGAVSYHLQLSENKNFEPMVVDQSSIKDRSLTVEKTLKDGTYYYRVQAEGWNGKKSSFSTAKLIIDSSLEEELPPRFSMKFHQFRQIFKEKEERAKSRFKEVI